MRGYGLTELAGIASITVETKAFSGDASTVSGAGGVRTLRPQGLAFRTLPFGVTVALALTIITMPTADRHVFN